MITIIVKVSSDLNLKVTKLVGYHVNMKLSQSLLQYKTPLHRFKIHITGLDGNKSMQVWNIACHFLPVLLQVCGEFNTCRGVLQKLY